GRRRRATKVAVAELGGELVRDLHHPAPESGRLSPRHPERRPGDAHRRHDASAVIANRRADAAQAFLDLLVVDCVPTLADRAQLSLEQRGRGDRVPRVRLEATAADERVEVALRQVREQRLADRGAVRGIALSYA